MFSSRFVGWREVAATLVGLVALLGGDPLAGSRAVPWNATVESISSRNHPGDFSDDTSVPINRMIVDRGFAFKWGGNAGIPGPAEMVRCDEAGRFLWGVVVEGEPATGFHAVELRPDPDETKWLRVNSVIMRPPFENWVGLYNGRTRMPKFAYRLPPEMERSVWLRGSALGLTGTGDTLRLAIVGTDGQVRFDKSYTSTAFDGAGEEVVNCSLRPYRQGDGYLALITCERTNPAGPDAPSTFRTAILRLDAAGAVSAATAFDSAIDFATRSLHPLADGSVFLFAQDLEGEGGEGESPPAALRILHFAEDLVLHWGIALPENTQVLVDPAERELILGMSGEAGATVCRISTETGSMESAQHLAVTGAFELMGVSAAGIYGRSWKVTKITRWGSRPDEVTTEYRGGIVKISRDLTVAEELVFSSTSVALLRHHGPSDSLVFGQWWNDSLRLVTVTAQLEQPSLPGDLEHHFIAGTSATIEATPFLPACMTPDVSALDESMALSPVAFSLSPRGWEIERCVPVKLHDALRTELRFQAVDQFLLAYKAQGPTPESLQLMHSTDGKAFQALQGLTASEEVQTLALPLPDGEGGLFQVVPATPPSAVKR